MGEFLYFCIYVVQQLGIMFGVGAQTVLLCMYLAAVHHGEKDNPHANYAHAAHFALGLGLLFIFVSGAVAVGIHALNGELATIFSPVFIFKWLLILFLTPAFLLYGRVTGSFYYAFTGATWYALFLVHSLGLITTWSTLAVLYVLWLLFFSLMWAAFVAVMRWRMIPKALPAPVVVSQKEFSPQVAVVKIETPPPPAPKPLPPPPPPPPAPKPVPPPPPAPKPIPPTPPKPEPLPISSPFPKIPYVAPKPMASPMPPVPPKPIPPPPPPPPPSKPAPLPPPVPKPPVAVVIAAPPVQTIIQSVEIVSPPRVSLWQRILVWASGRNSAQVTAKEPAPSSVSVPIPPPPPKPVVVTVAPNPVPPPAPKPAPPPPPPAPKPTPPAPPALAPKPVVPPRLPPLPKPESAAVIESSASKKPSFWSRLFAFFASKEKAPQLVLPPPPPLPPVVAVAPVPKPVPPPPTPPVPGVVPVPQKPVSPPALRPLSLPVGSSQENSSYPLPKAATAGPSSPSAPEIPAETKNSFIQEVIDHMLVPALRIMPQTPEDIAKHNRPPVVKSDDTL